MKKFCVTVTVHGTQTTIIEAENKEQAEEQLNSMDNEHFTEIDDVQDVDWTIQEMYPRPEGGYTTRKPK